MKTARKLGAAAGVAMLLSVGACSWNDDNSNEPDPTPPVLPAAVPASAAVSTAAFVSYIVTLGASDQTSEPLLIVDPFAVPADESSEPQVLT